MQPTPPDLIGGVDASLKVAMSLRDMSELVHGGHDSGEASLCAKAYPAARFLSRSERATLLRLCDVLSDKDRLELCRRSSIAFSAT